MVLGVHDYISRDSRRKGSLWVLGGREVYYAVLRPWKFQGILDTEVVNGGDQAGLYD
jgi:hypothetical protein